MHSRFAIGPLIITLVMLAGIALAAGCDDDKKESPAPTETAVAAETPTIPSAQTPAQPTEPAAQTPGVGGPPPIDGEVTDLPSGLRIIENESVPGTAVADAGKTVSVHYTGWLEDGTQFDSSIGGQPYTFILGNGDVIAGWDEGIEGMTVGSKRRLIIPPDLAYGAPGRGIIPPNATLTFDTELVSVE